MDTHDLDFMHFKENQFEHLKTNIDKALVFGQLKSLKNLALYIENMRESLTRLLVVNGIEDEEDFIDKVAQPTRRSASP
tara:strand:+ start:1179 stop:1415 length:237 start_codon:yes stop_codon:yes gene_type:complete